MSSIETKLSKFSNLLIITTHNLETDMAVTKALSTDEPTIDEINQVTKELEARVV